VYIQNSGGVSLKTRNFFSSNLKKYVTLIFLLYPVLSISTIYAQDKPPRKELVWYQYEKCYHDLDEVKEDLEKGILVRPPEYFSDLDIINEAVGDIDPDNASYYWSAKPETLGLLLSVAREYKTRLKDKDAQIHISGLLRTLEYQDILSLYNNWADLGRSTHTNGATFDITIHPYYVKEVNKITTLEEILTEFHEKEEVFFIDESSNSCFHVCLNPDCREKYETFFYKVTGEYEISSYYNPESTIFSPLKDGGDLKKALENHQMVDLSKISSENLPIEISLPAGKKEMYSSLRPETTGLLFAISQGLKEQRGKDFLLPLSELMRTSEEQNKLLEKDVLLPSNSPFIYGAAFQIDASKLKDEEKNTVTDYLEKLSDMGDILFIKREDSKYDVILKPEVIPKYRLVYNENFPRKQTNVLGFKFELRYLYITLALIGGLLFGFIVLRFYRLRQIMKKMKRLKRKKKGRMKKKAISVEEISKLPEISALTKASGTSEVLE